jgi:ribosomal protein L11 methyltransferase
MELADTLLAFLQPGGTLLLSGLLDTQAAALCDHYADRISLQVESEKDGWVCLRGKLQG